ncbi:MAG: YjjG family noncanonical pyrimidine nucleotidase [Anaerolineales bacterium]
MKYATLLFDLDDTLFDFRKSEAEALRRTLETLDIPFLPAYVEIYAACNQQVWREFERGEISSEELRVKRFALFFEKVAQISDLPPARFDPQTASPLYLQNLALGAYLLPGAEALIRSLRPLCRLALVTNGIAEVQRSRLALSPLADSFTAGLYISEEIGAAKPSAAYFQAVFAALGDPPRETVLLIGDSLSSDMQGGLNAGIDTCWFNPRRAPGSLPVTYQIQRLEELPALL